MQALREAKKSKAARKKAVGGSLAVKHKRATNQRSHVVRNIVRRAELYIAPSERTFQSGENFAFVLEDKKDLLFLPTLGYIGGRPEVETIKSRVVADNMTQREINYIADAVERRLNSRLEQLATKDDIKQLASKEDIKQLASKEDIKQLASKEDVRKLAAALGGLKSLVEERLPPRPSGVGA